MSTGEERTDIVEIDAIAVEEWDRDQHTPRAIESNLAALVKQSATSASGPVRAPKLDDAWDDAKADAEAKPRTTTNTLRRTSSMPAVPGGVKKTMALPTVAVAKPAKPAKPAKKATPATATPAAVVATKPAREPTPLVIVAATKAARDATPVPVVATKPARDATPVPVVATKPAREPTPPVVVVATKPARDATPVPVVATKPARDATPVPVAATKPAREPTPPLVIAATKPARTPTPPPQPALSRTPTPVPMAAPAPTLLVGPPSVAAPTASAAFAPMDLPVWPPEPPTRAATEPAMLPPPPVVGAEDWDDPEGRTSIGNRAAPVAAEGSGPRESSVIVDLEAKSRAVAPDAPRRPQTYPVIQTSERNTTTSGVFSMPSAPVVGKGSQPEPVIPERASSGWNTPLPQALPGEPPGSPPVPSFPSAAGLDYHGARDTAIAEPVRQHDPTEPRIKRGPLLASVLPTPRSRRVALLAAAGVVAILGIVAVAGHGDPKPSTTAVVTHEPRTPSTSPRTSPASADHPVASTPGAVASTPGAAATTVATAEPSLPVATPNPTKPAKVQPVRRRISRAKKPVVVDYDKQRDPASADSPDQALAKARAAYAAGNQHLFAGETSSAIASYQQALSLYPGYVAGYRGLGLAYAQASNRPAAVDAFKTYVRLAPTAKDVALIQKRIANLSVR